MKWIIGLAAGAAAYYLLRTEKGKELVETLKKQADNLGENLSCIAEDLLKKGSSYVDKAAGKANGTV